MHTAMNIERLESRIAPAILFTYTEFDGDFVTVNISKGNVGDAIFTHPPVPGLFGDQLQRINLNGNQVFAGANITITAKPQLLGDTVRGDGLANVGFIDASGGGGIDLGAVKINGDLGKILAGDATLTTPGVKSLSVLSLGRFGTTTGASDLFSTVKGALGSVGVKTDVVDAIVRADSFGPITVGGSVSGKFDSNGNMGIVKISGDLRGDGSTRGVISADGNIGAITIGGSLNGATIAGAGTIFANGNLGPVKIGGDILGAGSDPGGIFFPTSGGFIASGGNIASVNVGGSILASGDGANGFINCIGDMGPVKIGRDLRGIDSGSGVISAGGKLANVTIGGSVSGIGSEDNKARISSGGDMGPVTIRGSLASLGGDNSAEISSGGKMGAIVIGSNVDGGGAESGFIHTTNGGAIASVTIGGSLIGGADFDAGKIFTSGALGPVKISGDVNGNLGSPFNGMIDADRIASVTIGGSLIGGSRNNSGQILGRTSLGAVKIGGDVFGGTNDSTGYIASEGRITSVFIGGSIIAENTGLTPDKTGSIRAGDDIGSITVRGNLMGNSNGLVIISARGKAGLSATATSDLAIGNIFIGGRVEQAQILAGYSFNLAPINADAQIGSVTVNGDWIASSLIAGVMAGGDGLFGTFDDAKISGAGVKDTGDALGAISKIASVIIRGHALGTLSSSDSALFGIEAQKIGSIKLGGTFAPLHAGASNDLFGDRLVLGPTRTPSGSGFDFHAFEV